MKQRVLFVCVHNSARSQMAEAIMNHHGGEWFSAESAGIEPGRLNPIVVKAMLEMGIDISGNSTKGVEALIAKGKPFDIVVTVCDAANSERCPVVPGAAERIHWGFDDPSSFQGTEEEKLAKTRIVRDEINSKILEFLESRRVHREQA